MTAVVVNIHLSKYSLDEKKKNAIHDKHSGKKAVEKFGNKAHHKMPNDTVPDGFLGIDNHHNRAGGSFKIPSNGEESIGINHRYIYGHDIFKPWEIFSKTDKIEDIVPVFNSKKLGIFVKQVCHLWFDLFSPTGLPAPGTTYFTERINAKLSKDLHEYNVAHPDLPNKKMSEEMQKFAIHIEDVIKSGGIEMLIQIYCLIRRNVNNVTERDNFFYCLQQFLCFDIKGSGFFMGNRTFKEYEIGMIVHMNVITIVALHGEFSYLSADLFFKDMVQWLRLNRKWDVEYKKHLITILQELTQCKIPEELILKCKELCQIYNIEFKNDAHYIIEILEKF